MVSADYYIIGMKFEKDKEKIRQVKYRTGKTGGSMGMTRRNLIREIKEGKIVYTMTNNRIEERLKVVSVKNEDYLRINRKKIAEDNLGRIPKY